MASTESSEIERAIRHFCEQRDFERAISAALSGYGREILEFLIALHRSEDDASEVFSIFSEGLWRGIQGFSWGASFRTWAYVIARRASLRFRRDKHRRASWNEALPSDSVLSAIEQQVRTETPPYLRTERRARLLQLRDSLPKDDQVLLMLRVDRQLAWRDLARVLHDSDPELNDDALRRESDRLRQRFRSLKVKLYEMGRREGLLDKELSAEQPADPGGAFTHGRRRGSSA